MKTLIQACALSIAALGLSAPATAAWPERPITLIVPAAPGGTTDITARLLSEKLGAALGTTVVIENRAGAAGIIGTQALLRSAPDGYTIGFGNIGPNGINYSLYKNLPYKSTDFAPITLVISVPNILVVNSKSPYTSVKDLVDSLKNDPKGNYSYGSPGTGQSPHMSSEMFSQRTGLTLTHVPYKGMGPAVAALLGGQVTFIIDNLPSSIPFIRSGQFRALAITGEQRSAQLPEIPTMAEAGIKDMVVTAWFGFVAPAGTPADVVNKIQQATKKVLEMPDIKERFATMGGIPGGGTPAEFGAFMDKEQASWRKIVEAAKISLD